MFTNKRSHLADNKVEFITGAFMKTYQRNNIDIALKKMA